MFKVPEVSPLEMAFPANVLDWMPPYRSVPDPGEPWNKIAAKWFYFGLSGEAEFTPRDGVDAKKALMAISACLGSYAPKHEHKMEAAAFLLSEWFSEIKGWEAE